MKIIIIGDFSDGLDEGYKNVSKMLAKYLEYRIDVYRLDIKKCFSPGFWLSALSLEANVIHIITQPTVLGLSLLRIISLLHTHSRTVVSSLRTERIANVGIPALLFPLAFAHARPDLVLVQESKAGRLLEGLGANNVKMLPNGVDISRFKPASQRKRANLRRKYGLVEWRKVILHVGHIRKERNVHCLGTLAREGYQVVLVGSTYLGVDKSLGRKLKDLGVMVIEGYQPNIEEFYQISDCYVFPVFPGNTISMPLSILEALACNLPVVTTRFNAIQERFGEGNGIYYTDLEEEIIEKTDLALRESILTRHLVEKYSWDAVTATLIKYYKELNG